MRKEAIITSNGLNSYGSRVLTEGGDLRQYERNPVLLFMHNRAFNREDLPIGRIENMRIDGDKLIGTPVFDLNDEFARKIADKWENGFLRMLSAGIEIIETSTDASVMLPGQTRPTIVKSKLDEVSIVDIGANDDAIVLKKNGRRVYDKNINEVLRLMSNNQQNQKTMSEKTEKVENNDVQSEQLQKEIAELQAQVKALQKENEELKLAGITGAVDKAIAEKRLDAEKKAQFVELGKKVGIKELEGILGAMTPKAKLSAVLNGGRALVRGAHPYCEWKTLHDVPAEKMMELRNEHPEEYQRLYKATYQL